MPISEADRQICETIRQYIFDTLSDCIDSDIFSCDTLEDLGKLYYNKLLLAITGTTEQHIDAVIRALAHRDMTFEHTVDYLKNICRIMHIEHSPKTLFAEIQTKYQAIFNVKYTAILALADVERNKIDSQILSIINAEAVARQRISSAKSLTYDLETEENKLYDLDIQKRFLETQKEMYNWVCDYLTSQLNDFCNINDTCAVEIKLKSEALSLSKDDEPLIDFLFEPYNECVHITEDILQRPHTVFYKVKFYPFWASAFAKYRYATFHIDDTSDAIEQYKLDLSDIPAFDELHNSKQNDTTEYLSTLKKCIQSYDVLDKLENNIIKGICLRNRKDILIKTIRLFKDCEYELFGNIAPIQIEGLFADFLRDSTIFSRFTNPRIYTSAVLKEKINVLQQCSSSLYPEAIQYFKFYFNNIVRNRIAHGSYHNIYNNSEQAEVFACETLLDLNFMVYMLSRQSESEKMYRFIHEYKPYYFRLTKSDNPHFGALFNDMIGDKVVSEYDQIEKFRPVQIAYWLVNPYYEKIYGAVADKNELLELRQDFLSQSFWEYVVDKLKTNLSGGCFLSISKEMKSVVNGLFKCDISVEVKRLLGEANKLLSLIDIEKKLK